MFGRNRSDYISNKHCRVDILFSYSWRVYFLILNGSWNEFALVRIACIRLHLCETKKNQKIQKIKVQIVESCTEMCNYNRRL